MRLRWEALSNCWAKASGDPSVRTKSRVVAAMPTRVKSTTKLSLTSGQSPSHDRRFRSANGMQMTPTRKTGPTISAQPTGTPASP